MNFDNLELLADVAGQRTSVRENAMDVGFGPICTDAAGPVHTDAQWAGATRPVRADVARSVYTNATPPVRADAEWTNTARPAWTDAEKTDATRRYVYADAPCTDAVGPACVGATGPAQVDAGRSVRIDATREKTTHAGES